VLGKKFTVMLLTIQNLQLILLGSSTEVDEKRQTYSKHGEIRSGQNSSKAENLEDASADAMIILK
jgi:hypothetical protein